jgi:hypothetical protein
MSEHRKHFDIDENRLAVFDRDHWQCRHVDANGHRCQSSATEIAHGISQGESMVSIVRTRWNGEFDESRPYNWIEHNVIHNGLNVFASCRKHNDYFNIGNNPGAVRERLYAIREKLKQEGVVK